MKVYEGYVKFPDGRVQLMTVSAPDTQSARAMLEAYGQCTGVAEKSQEVRWS
jgi:hypothetical protein